MQVVGVMRVVVVVIVMLGAGLGLARADCVVDASVKDKSERLEQQNLLQTLNPIMGQR